MTAAAAAIPPAPPASAAPPAPRCVGPRVDWFEPRFSVVLDPEVLAHFVRDPKDPRARAPRGPQSFVARAALARKFRVASVSLPIPGAAPGEWPVFQMAMSGESKTVLTSGTCRVVIQENAPRSPDAPREDPGWNVSVAYSGTALMALGWQAAARDAWRLAGALGEIVAVRMGRLDLCADFCGWPIEPSAEWCTRPQLRMRALTKCKRLPVARAERAERARTAIALARRFERGGLHYLDMLEQMPDLDDAYYYPAGNLTGWKFGKGQISARIYDKHAEMRMRADAAGSQADKRRAAGDKREAEETWWRAHGWTGGTVTRVEVQLRGPVLHELDARCEQRARGASAFGSDAFVAEMRRHIDRCWRYFAGAPDELARREPLPVDALGRCVKCAVKHASAESCPHTLAPRAGWLRQIDRVGARPRSECSATPAWRAVQAVSFERVVTEIPRRTRKRGAVRATQVLGCALALLGYVERLEHPRNPVPDPETGECDQVIAHSEDAHARRVFESGARGKAMFREQVQLMFRQCADEVADTLEWIHEQRPEDALALFWTRVNAARARFKPHLAKTHPDPQPRAKESPA
jgi:hypothetical protein